MTTQRIERLKEQLKIEISDIFKKELKDPRVGFVSITDVEVSGDLRHVKVFVSIMGDEESKAQTMEGLERATGFVRTEIGKRIRLRYTPEIRFKMDNSMERGARIFELLNQVKDERAGDASSTGVSAPSREDGPGSTEGEKT
ncbi:MAG: 30S ribosome-binding factor RbfA [Firmicutes bacterium]|nr:30S ribosome-binding factor RbfA [Bacillota bacterium]